MKTKIKKNKGELVGVVFTSCVAKEKLTDGD